MVAIVAGLPMGISHVQDIWCGTNPRPVPDAASLMEFLGPEL